MTAWVLVLAGVAAGDGGVRAGAATAPVTESVRLDFSRDWEGTVRFADEAEPIRLSRGRLTDRKWGPLPFALTLSPGGLARGRWGEVRFHGTYRAERGRLLVCFMSVDHPRPTACTPADGHLLTLRPAPRRP